MTPTIISKEGEKMSRRSAEMTEEQKEQKKRESARKRRIKKEKDSLLNQFSDIPQDLQVLVVGLIDRAAFLKISCEDCEEDINLHGETELFSQSKDMKPYLKKRASVEVHNQNVKNYTAIMRQLTDLVPKPKISDGDFEQY